MKLSNEAAELLIPAPTPKVMVPDAYDISVADILTPWRDVEHVDIGLIGTPFDTAVSGRRGCRFGPDGIRDAMVFCNVFEPSLGVDLSDGLTLSDFGNIDALFTDVKGTHERVETVLTELYKQSVTPLIFGGDHSLAYPDIKALLNVYDDRVGVINIDAHLDLRHSHHGEISSGTPFRRLIEDPDAALRPERFVEFGINGWLNSKYYFDYCREAGIEVITARDIHTDGIGAALDHAIEILDANTDAMFVSFDIDAIDLAHVPGTNVPGAGGLTSFQALEAVWRLGQHPKCRGMDLVEVAPPLDQGNVSSIMAASLSMQFLGATQRRLSQTSRRAVPA